MAAGAASRPRDLAAMATAEAEACLPASGHVGRSRRPSRRGPSRCPCCRHGRPPAARAQVSAAGAASLRDRRGCGRARRCPPRGSAFPPALPGARSEAGVPARRGALSVRPLREGTGAERGAGLSCHKAALLGSPVSAGLRSLLLCVSFIRAVRTVAVRRWRGAGRVTAPGGAARRAAGSEGSVLC